MVCCSVGVLVCTVLRWFLRVGLALKAAPQCEHLKGFSPVWLKKWYCSDSLRVKDLSHRLHLNLFSAVISGSSTGRVRRMWSGLGTFSSTLSR